MKKSLLLIIFTVSISSLFAQLDQAAFTESHIINRADSNKLFLSVINQNIVKNNEYFNHIIPGYTLLGSQANFRLKYYPTKNTMVKGGVHLQYYYGMDKIERVMPLITFSYTPVKGMYFVLGNIYGGFFHNYPEPVYKFERFMEDPPETGFQFLYNNRWFHFDFFVNWRYFLLPDDLNHKEKFTAGISSYLNLFKPESRLQIQIPVQFLYNHKGGQYDTLDIPLETLQNTVLGIKMSYAFQGFIKTVGANFHYITYKDGSGEKLQPFENGHGIMPEIYLKSKFVNLHAGYWKSYQFIAPIGEPLFSSVSYRPEYEGDVFPEREMFYYKLDIHKKISQGLFFGVRYEGYLDILGNIVGPDDGHHDFSYSIFINFNRDFFLLKTGK